MSRALRLAADVWRAIHREELNINLRIGLGDPADTGLLWGFVGPVAAILKNSQNSTINIEPEFFEAAMDIEGSGKIRFYPLQLIWLTVAFSVSPNIWRTQPLVIGTRVW